MKLIDCNKSERERETLDKVTYKSCQENSSISLILFLFLFELFTHFDYRLESITKWDYSIIKCYAVAPSELPLLYLSASLSLSLCALINGHSFSSAFFLFFLLFTAPLPQLDTLHLVQSPNILTAVAVSCDVNCDVSAHGELQLCIEVCTQSVKYFGHPSGTTSFRLCRCQLSGKGTGSARQGRRFVACTGLHVLLTPLSLALPFFSVAFSVLPSMFFFSHAHFSVF